MSNPSAPLPSSAFQAALETFERSIKINVPEWLKMTLALWSGYSTLSNSDELSLMFAADNEFDMAMLTWCYEGENREKPNSTHTLDKDTPFPSIRFQRVLSADQKTLNDDEMPKGLPPLLYMGASLNYAYMALHDSGLLEAMFNRANPFDAAMLLWCVAARHRTSKCNSLVQANLSRN